ncbi:FGFR1 oncoprotein partner [Trebouxia sp. C0009 RCD-2024]
MEEIKETVIQVLDKQGVLATLKAQLRACVFAVVDGREGPGYGTDLEQRASNAHKARVASTAEGKLLLALVHEFLAWTNMPYAQKVYEAEAGLDKGAIARDQLCHQTGIDQLVEEPVLLTVLHRFMSNGAATSSPRIAAKAKSSISAKPGGHTVNISAAAMQNPSMPTQDVMKATHYPMPASVPAAAAAAAAMHAGAQHQRPAQTQEKTGTKLDASSPLTMSPGSSPTPSPTGPALPADTPQVSPRQLAAAQKASATRHASATGRGSEASIPAAHAEVPMIRQVAPESSSTSLQPSTSGASIISESIDYAAEDSDDADDIVKASRLLTKAAVKAHTDQQTALGSSRRPGQPAEHQQQQQRSEGLQSPGSSVSQGSPGLSLSVPSSANRKIFAEQKAVTTPIKVAIPTEVNRKAFPDSPGALISPGDNSTVYEPDSLSASAKSSPVRHVNGDDAARHSASTSPVGTDQHAAWSPSHTTPSGSSLTPNRLSARLPPLAPLQASPTRRSAEQIKRELREQDTWFDDTDESADGSLESPVAPSQTWKVHQGLGAGDAHSAGTMNAAFLQTDALSSRRGQQLDDLELDTF